MAQLIIVLSLAGLIFLAYKGMPVILFAPFFALIAAATVFGGADLLPAYTELFLPRLASFIKAYFPIFLLGAVFGKVMEDTGQAKSISHKIVQIFGVKRAILAVVLSSSILTYGGISVFVVVFSVYAFGCHLYKEAGIPKRLLPATIAFGSWTYCMDMIPGTPQIQNIIPTKLYGTTSYAAPTLSIVSAIILFGIGMTYFEFRRRQAQRKGEGYGDHTLNEPILIENETFPPFLASILPLLIVLVGNLVLTRYMLTWDAAHFASKYPGLVLNNVVGIWALTVSLCLAIIVSIAIGWKRVKPIGLGKMLYAGTLGSLLAVMNTASEVGYGGVVASLPGFSSIAKAFMNINAGGSPLLATAISTTIISGVTGSSSGGLSVSIEVLGKHFVNWMNVTGTNPEVMHRIMAMASGGMDTLPHNGAVVTLLAYCGLTHKQAYMDIFAVTLMKTFVAFIAVGLATLGLH